MTRWRKVHKRAKRNRFHAAIWKAWRHNPPSFHTGGIIRQPDATPLPEGVVGRTFTGEPIYDGDWFDQQMNREGSITIHFPPKTIQESR